MGPGSSTTFDLNSAGNLTILGTLTQNSKRDTKENFKSINPVETLSKVLHLPISSWNFKFDSSSVRHMGPMAQDFRAAFGLGKNETSIAPLDTVGVALSAIQGLHQMIEERDKTIDTLKEDNEKLEKQLDQIRQRLTRLETL
ncbi:MAG: hypothetical protein GKR87_12760 [Kiritimatiellae bacterium]|nr:hypothetical protein [Kiritimatiellia bacterium]